MTHATPDRAVTFGIATARQSQPVASEPARPAQGDVSMSNHINLRRRGKPAQGASTIGHEQHCLHVLNRRFAGQTCSRMTRRARGMAGTPGQARHLAAPCNTPRPSREAPRSGGLPPGYRHPPLPCWARTRPVREAVGAVEIFSTAIPDDEPVTKEGRVRATRGCRGRGDRMRRTG